MSDRGAKVQALKLKYEAEIAEYKVDVENYLKHSVGVAEHPHIVESLDLLISKLANAEDKLNSLINHFSVNLYERDL
jgi:uncharacterized protein (DUF342 family)